MKRLPCSKATVLQCLVVTVVSIATFVVRIEDEQARALMFASQAYADDRLAVDITTTADHDWPTAVVKVRRELWQNRLKLRTAGERQNLHHGTVQHVKNDYCVGHTYPIAAVTSKHFLQLRYGRRPICGCKPREDGLHCAIAAAPSHIIEAVTAVVAVAKCATHEVV